MMARRAGGLRVVARLIQQHIKALVSIGMVNVTGLMA